MLTTGIKDLKNNLSKYIGYVKKGEIVYITDHNSIVAEITQPHKQISDSLLSEYLDSESRNGRIQFAKTFDTKFSSKRSNSSTINYKSIYFQVRDDRF